MTALAHDAALSQFVTTLAAIMSREPATRFVPVPEIARDAVALTGHLQAPKRRRAQLAPLLEKYGAEVRQGRNDQGAPTVEVHFLAGRRVTIERAALAGPCLPLPAAA